MPPVPKGASLYSSPRHAQGRKNMAAAVCASVDLPDRSPPHFSVSYGTSILVLHCSSSLSETQADIRELKHIEIPCGG